MTFACPLAGIGSLSFHNNQLNMVYMSTKFTVVIPKAWMWPKKFTVGYMTMTHNWGDSLSSQS